MILKKVLLKPAPGLTIKDKEEYLLYVRILTCIDGVLKGEVMKLKLLSECWDQS